MNVGDKAPEVLGVNEKGERIFIEQLPWKESGALFLSQGQYVGLYGRSLQLARQLFCAEE